MQIVLMELRSKKIINNSINDCNIKNLKNKF